MIKVILCDNITIKIKKKKKKLNQVNPECRVLIKIELFNYCKT